MHLRSGRTIGSSRSDAASRVPTQGSETRSVAQHLDTIREDTSSESSFDRYSQTGSEMSRGDHSQGQNMRPSPPLQSRDMHEPPMTNLGNTPAMSNPFVDTTPLDLEYDVRLKYETTNAHGALLYRDPYKQVCFKLADVITPFDPRPWVNYQENSYMGMDGARYIFTNEPWKIDNMGSIVEQQAATTAANIPIKDKGKAKAFEVDIITVDRVQQDWIDREVYHDNVGNYYATPKHPMDELPEKHVLFGETWVGSETQYKDNMNHMYRKLDWDEIMNLTYQTVPIFADLSPRATARPEETAYFGETIAPKPTMNETKGKFTHEREQPELSFGTTMRKPTFESSAPPWMTMRSEPYPTQGHRGYIDRRIAGHTAISEPPRPPPRSPEVPHRMRGRDSGRRHEDEYSRKVRPSTLQKLMKKYDGSGDPYDHTAAFRQVVHAEQVTDYHTQIEGFGLTLEGKALSWFQTLEPSSKVSPQILEDDFIAAFSKMGIKHGASSKIHSFKQEPHETVRDCVNRLKQYIARSPDEEKPSQKLLISIFLEGLVNKTLHAHLYAKKHTSFNECCLDAMDYDDNFDVDEDPSGKNKKNSARTLESSSSATKELNTEEIAEIVLKKMGHLYRPSYRPQQQYTRTTPVGPYVCGGCGGDHRTEDCKTFSPLVNNQPTKKYCQMCSWNYTHATQDCNRIARMRMEQQSIYPGSTSKAICCKS